MSATVPETSIEWALLADYVMLDNSGKLSIIGIFDRLYLNAPHAMHPMAFVVARWRGAPNAVLASELRIWSPGRELLVGAPQALVKAG
jgi:hypothetical protein